MLANSPQFTTPRHFHRLDSQFAVTYLTLYIVTGGFLLLQMDGTLSEGGKLASTGTEGVSRCSDGDRWNGRLILRHHNEALKQTSVKFRL